MTKYTRTSEVWADRDGREFPVRVERSENVPALVTFGRRGHTVYFKRNGDGSCEEQGYDSPEDFFAVSHWWAHDFAHRRDAKAFEGVRWVDTRPAVETDEGYAWAFKGPLDGVDVETWVRGWKAHGARAGFIRGGQFVED